MWELVSDCDNMSSVVLEDSMVLFLDFADGSLLLLYVGEELSIDLERESTDLIGSIGKVVVD